MSTHPVEKDEVLREFAPLSSKYRVRLIRTGKGPNRRTVLDIREYVTGSFEGFTRRGIKLASREDMDLLRDILKEVLDLNL